MKAIRNILLIFKTHLDIGFTDTASNIKNKYLHEYIPNAIKIGYDLINTNWRFKWTTGSWLIYEALKEDDGTLAKAIDDGIICWHALPFTSHTDIISRELFSYGLSVSKELDQRFGKKTIAGKMTDVPGHTLGIVPLLEEYGVELLHIGVNPATPLPPVPTMFRWKRGESSIIVIYQGDYGQNIQIDDTLVVFAHTGDNLGPQSANKVVDIYRSLENKYPNCCIQTGTLNDLAILSKRIKSLPTVEAEIGDTWIHGIQTDPKKVSLFLQAQRKLKEICLQNIDLTDNLLLLPEHTWGKDVKSFYPRTDNYLQEVFMYTNEDDARMNLEESWQEQRSYAKAALHSLNMEEDYPCSPFDLTSYSHCEPFDLSVSLSWQLFDNDDYARYRDSYLRLSDENSWWALWDFTKYGLPDYEGITAEALPTEYYSSSDSSLVKLCFTPSLTIKYGLPELWIKESKGLITVKWFDKKASRLPQAFWMKLKGFEENWEIHKMGQWISPESVIGSPLISGTDQGIRNRDIEIRTLDSALVAPFGRHLLEYGFKPSKQDMYFNLYNNIWNTNFPMWYSDDAIFRFEIKERNE